MFFVRCSPSRIYEIPYYLLISKKWTRNCPPSRPWEILFIVWQFSYSAVWCFFPQSRLHHARSRLKNSNLHLRASRGVLFFSSQSRPHCVWSRLKNNQFFFLFWPSSKPHCARGMQTLVNLYEIAEEIRSQGGRYLIRRCLKYAPDCMSFVTPEQFPSLVMCACAGVQALKGR